MPVNKDRANFVSEVLDTAKDLGDYFTETQKEDELWLGLQSLFLYYGGRENPILTTLSLALPSKEQEELRLLAEDFRASLSKDDGYNSSLKVNLSRLKISSKLQQKLCKYISLVNTIYGLQQERIVASQTHASIMTEKQQRLYDVFTQNNGEIGNVIFLMILDLVKQIPGDKKTPYMEEFIAVFRYVDECYANDIQEKSIQKLMIIDKLIASFPQDKLVQRIDKILQDFIQAHKSDEQKTKVFITRSSSSSEKLSFFSSSQVPTPSPKTPKTPQNH